MPRYIAIAVESSVWACPADRSGVQCAQAQVAVGLERAHAERVGQGEGLAVGGCGWLDPQGLALRRHLPQEPQSPRLVAALLLRPGEGPRSAGADLLPVARQEIRFAQPGDRERLLGEASRTLGFFQHPLQQGERLSHTPGQGIGVPKAEAVSMQKREPLISSQRLRPCSRTGTARCTSP
jgi:hypothetical protein